MATVTVTPQKGILRRPMATTGFWSWFTTVDHKKIGILYGISSFLFFIIGGVEALLIRSQLAKPSNTVLNAEQYNQIFTMHGLTMIFLFVMPMSAAFFNYLIPLMIGARDVAFPRLNALSFWVFLLGALFLNSSWFLGGAPDGGWFAYAPNSTTDPGNGMTFYALGLLITGIASTVGAINLAVTVINMRAPGMSLFRMPVFVWMGLVVQFLLAFSLPIITVALFQLLFDRRWDTAFFDPTRGGEPLLWQHMFWLFGHPEVYILILPAFGIFSEILPVFARKPLFGYQFVVFSRDRDRVHRVRRVGAPHVRGGARAGGEHRVRHLDGDHRGADRRQDLQLDGHAVRGDLHFESPMLFAIGGDRDVRDRRAVGRDALDRAVGLPADRHLLHRRSLPLRALRRRDLRDLRGGVLLVAEGVRADAGRAWGKVQFWIMLIGFNLTFGPMHILGLGGMIRREYTYPASLGLTFWNQMATVGAFTIALSVLLFIINVVRTQLKPAGLENEDPWDARTLEWTTASPPPAYNFEEIPTVHSLDEFWHRKYVEDETGRLVRVPAGASGERTPGRRPRDPPAEPVVLADRGLTRVPDARLRGPVLLLVARRGGRRRDRGRTDRMGARALGGGVERWLTCRPT